MKEITVYDLNDDSLNDLVQWDRDVVVCIRRPEITQGYRVHFFNKNSDEAYVVEGSYDGGTLKAKIPNALLCSAEVLFGYVYVTDDGGSKSAYGFRLQVRRRPKPSDIVYVDTKDWIDITEVLGECRDYANSASESAGRAAASEAAAAESEQSSGKSAAAAADSAEAADGSAKAAEESERNAAASEKAAEDWSLWSKSYAVGEGDKRPGEKTDSAKFYYEQALRISQGLEGALLPMGTIEFAKLAEVLKSPGYMYNISDEFTSDDTFEDGGGKHYGAGSNVYCTIGEKWDVMAPNSVSGIKGAKEETYHQGLVDISAEDVGAVPEGGDTAENTVTFDDADPGEESGFPVIENITSGEKLKSIFAKLRVWGRGIAKLITLLGSTDISDIGDGTVTSALAALMADKLNKTDIVNDLLSTAADKALSAAMGKQLQDAVSKLNTDTSTMRSNISTLQTNATNLFNNLTYTFISGTAINGADLLAAVDKFIADTTKIGVNLYQLGSGCIPSFLFPAMALALTNHYDRTAVFAVTHTGKIYFTFKTEAGWMKWFSLVGTAAS